MCNGAVCVGVLPCGVLRFGVVCLCSVWCVAAFCDFAMAICYVVLRCVGRCGVLGRVMWLGLVCGGQWSGVLLSCVLCGWAPSSDVSRFRVGAVPSGALWRHGIW